MNNFVLKWFPQCMKNQGFYTSSGAFKPTPKTKTSRGAPQATVLGPLLFNFYKLQPGISIETHLTIHTLKPTDITGEMALDNFKAKSKPNIFTAQTMKNCFCLYFYHITPMKSRNEKCLLSKSKRSTLFIMPRPKQWHLQGYLNSWKHLIGYRGSGELSTTAVCSFTVSLYVFVCVVVLPLLCPIPLHLSCRRLL